MEKEALYALPVYGDILASSILQLAQENPGIAVADVERNLCGLKTKKKIKNVYYSGRFRLLPCRNVLEMIDRLIYGHAVNPKSTVRIQPAVCVDNHKGWRKFPGTSVQAAAYKILRVQRF